MDKGETGKKGFTIIEVLLVLAIAGLIFLMIFIAWPALSRTQRDSKRRDDIAILLRKVKDYQTNNRGALPPIDGDVSNVVYNASSSGISWSGFYHDYLGDGFQDPNGGNYVLNVQKCKNGGKAGDLCTNELADQTAFPSKMMVFIAGGCSGSRAVVTNNPRKIAVQYKLEGGGVYCANT